MFFINEFDTFSFTGFDRGFQNDASGFDAFDAGESSLGLKRTSATWDVGLELARLRQVSFYLFAYFRQDSQHLFSGYQASFLNINYTGSSADMAALMRAEGGEEFNRADWNKHWQQGGDWAFRRGGRRHLRQDQGRRALLVLFSQFCSHIWSINSDPILVLQLLLGGARGSSMRAGAGYYLGNGR